MLGLKESFRSASTRAPLNDKNQHLTLKNATKPGLDSYRYNKTIFTYVCKYILNFMETSEIFLKNLVVELVFFA